MPSTSRKMSFTSSRENPLSPTLGLSFISLQALSNGFFDCLSRSRFQLQDTAVPERWQCLLIHLPACLIFCVKSTRHRLVVVEDLAVVWSCLPFIRSGQNHLARHRKRGKKTRQTEEEVGTQHQGMDRPGVRQVPEGSAERQNGGRSLLNHLWCPNDPRG